VDEIEVPLTGGRAIQQWDACAHWAEACGQWLHTHQNEITISLST